LLVALAAAVASSAGQGEDYRIGSRDVLEIRVFDLEELNATVRVSEAGTVELPVIGEIAAAGLTQNGLAAAIEEALSGFVRQPQVFVFVREYQSQRVSIIGAVRSPGIYQMVGRTTLLEAISDAGGVNPTESSGRVRILREGLTGAPIEIDLGELLDKGNTAYNIRLKPGDVINVVVKEAFTIYVSGQVRTPGSFTLRESITLLKAVSLAGGFSDRAAANKVRIVRAKEDGTQEVIEVNFEDIQDGKSPDIQILPNDIIVVPETIF
jgi:polysaccharide export outer membrane protein